MRTLAIISDFVGFQHRAFDVLPCREGLSMDGRVREVMVRATPAVYPLTT